MVLDTLITLVIRPVNVFTHCRTCVLVQVINIVCERVLRVRYRGDNDSGYDSAAGTHQPESHAGRVASRVISWLDQSMASIRRFVEIQC